MSSNKNLSCAQRLALLPRAERNEIISNLTPEEEAALIYDWSFWARPNQLPPKGDWFTWFIRSGRGGGKTKSGAEWIIERARKGYKRFALVGETARDVRETMIEGESGIMACSPPDFKPLYEPSKTRLTWPNGTIANTFSGDKPDQLRGPNIDTLWFDELAKMRYAEESWRNAMFMLRLGNDPRALVTSTPRPLKIVKEILAHPKTVDVVYSSYENIANLADIYVETVLGAYKDTRLGKQEIYGQILEDNPGALWTLADIEDTRVKEAPSLIRIVVAIDPATTSTETSDETGIVAAGKSADGHYYVLADKTCKNTPDKWAKVAVNLYKKLSADRIIGETNNGGDLVESVIRTVDDTVSYKKVHASRGKQTRAEPISALYEQGKVHHVGSFADLEDQMVTWNPAEDKKSPDRVDSLCWAITSLMEKKQVSLVDCDLSGVTDLLKDNAYIF